MWFLNIAMSLFGILPWQGLVYFWAFLSFSLSKFCIMFASGESFSSFTTVFLEEESNSFQISWKVNREYNNSIHLMSDPEGNS